MAILEVDHLVKHYGERAAIDGITFTVEQGEIFGVLGPNGAGKTTLVECIEGLRAPDSGSISVCGLDPRRDEAKLRQLLGAQLQESQLPDKLTVGEAMRLYSSFYRAPVDWHELLGMLSLTAQINTRYHRLSGGQKQRLAIALALLGDPRVAILDELTTGLDPQARRDSWALIEALRDRGVTILLVTHFMEEAERLCDRIAVLDAGRIVALDSPSGLVNGVKHTQQLRLRPSAPLDPALLMLLPEVLSAKQSGEELVVRGKGNLLLAVSSLLAREQLAVEGLQIERASLEDAFVALTGHRLATREQN
ncbi:multidrug ABC transporter ATP-binding protein [Arthrobacter sp. MYb227]|uniref:ABC transporter ATP-binding protein n=1 Tax=Arthrobacter sp. MYb227 TaxID=1848601 RepID=UPI000CFDA08C|nr:ABC transporter ATP-binding protein [Arthrobacter sp. MYb227]PQZ93698.1 multidrug ABC transporter ATP-binding protein [Arthrobacter sp. MYb227]